MSRNDQIENDRASVHVSIDVPDLEAGLRFYTSVFGFRETSRPFSTMAVLDANNVMVCMHQKAAGSESSSAGADVRRYERHWTPIHLDLHVRDLDAVLDVPCSLSTVPSIFKSYPPRT